MESLSLAAGVDHIVWRHFAISTDEFSVGVNLVRGHDAWKSQGNAIESSRNIHSKAVPCIPAHISEALNGPVSIGAQQWPLGIVKPWISPGDIVTWMKTPQAIE
jgi:hypothetical protein